MHLACRRFQVRLPARVGMEAFMDVGDLLTMTVFTELSNDSGSHKRLCTLKMELGPFPTDGALLPNDQ